MRPGAGRTAYRQPLGVAVAISGVCIKLFAGAGAGWFKGLEGCRLAIMGLIAHIWRITLWGLLGFMQPGPAPSMGIHGPATGHLTQPGPIVTTRPPSSLARAADPTGPGAADPIGRTAPGAGADPTGGQGQELQGRRSYRAGCPPPPAAHGRTRPGYSLRVGWRWGRTPGGYAGGSLISSFGTSFGTWHFIDHLVLRLVL